MSPAVVSFLAYDMEKRISKHPEMFGTGCIEGVASPEASNNATAQTGFIPMMALGIPTTPTLAVILAALMINGLRPGPMLFLQNAEFTWTIIASMYIGNVILLILNLPLVGMWARLSLVPFRIIGPIIAAVCFVGAYSVRNSMFDAWICLIFGMVGFIIKKTKWPVAPLVLGFILGPMFEQSLRQTLQLSEGSLLILLTIPIALSLIVITIAMPIIIFSFTRLRSNMPVEDDESF
jgi:putative tricarboxylic transport membrane protein